MSQKIKVDQIADLTATSTELNYTDGVTSNVQTQLDAKLPLSGGALTGAVTTNSTFDGRDVSVDGAKLDGIEAGADVTDTTNVTAAGALMDSEVDADIKTLSLPANTTISAYGATLVDDATASAARTTLGLGTAATTASTDYATAAQGTTADAALPRTGGTMSGAIAMGANNITGAGTVSGTGFTLTNSDLDIGGWNIDASLYNTNTNVYYTNAIHNFVGNTNFSAGIDVTGNVTATGTVDGRDVATDGAKLDGIEAGATADQTNAEIRAAVEAATDSNVFTDADHTKLNGIATGATAYGDSDVDTHLNTSTAASSEVLSWTGTDYDWVAQSSGATSLFGNSNLIGGTGAGAVLDSSAGGAYYNVLLGFNSGNDITTGDKNTIVGTDAGTKITTASSNTFFGYRAGENATGAENTIVGQAAGYALTTGTKNTIIGHQVGTSTITGTSNTMVGYWQTGDSLTSGTYNVLLGGGDVTTGSYNALIARGGLSLTTGSYNFLVGEQAGSTITTGGYNILLGYSAGLRRASDSSSNIAMGWLALRGSNTTSSNTGTYNIALGNSAGYDITSGNSNVLLGKDAGTKITSGSSNVFIGHSAGYASAGVQATTGSNNIVIGSDATPSSATVSNEITIGNASNTSLRLPGLQSGASNGQVMTYNSSTGIIELADAGGGGADLYAANESSPTAQPSATGANAIAIGDSSVASGTQAMASGYKAVSVGSSSHACTDSYASGTNSFAAAIANNTASYGAIGANTIAMSQRAKASDGVSIAIGQDTIASNGGAAIGLEAVATGTGSLALGKATDSTGTGSLAVGQGAQATANYNLAIGLNANATAERAIAIGNNGVIAGSTYSTAIGHNSGFGGSVTATGSGAMSLGGSYASGADSFAAAMVNNTSSYGAQGINSIAMGTRAKSLSNYGVAIGFVAIATQQSTSLGPNSSAGGTSGIRSTAVGYQSQALGSNNTAIGSGSGTRTALYGDVAYSSAIGYSATSTRSGQISFGNGYVDNAQDSQYSITTLRCKTTNNTQTVMTTDNSTATALNQINLRDRVAMSFKGMVVARESAGSGTDCAAFEISGLIRQEAGGASTTVLVNSVITVIDNQPNWGLALSADTTLGGLKIEVTGASLTTIKWAAPIQCAEVYMP